MPDVERVLVFGMKDDSISVLHLDLSGRLLRVNTFMVIPGLPNHLSAATLDQDGMIAITGMAGQLTQGGTVFACRYDPVEQRILWARSYTAYTPLNFAFAITIHPVTGHYLLANNPLVPGVNNDFELIELDPATGDIRAGLTGYYNLQGSENINKMIFHEGDFYGIGRFSYSVIQDDMRNAVIKLDPTNGNVEWLRMGHVSPQGSARLYGIDLHIRDGDMYTMYLGDPSGSSTTSTYVFVQRASLDGDLRWVNQYNLPGMADFGYEMIPAGEDYIILARTQQSGGTLYLFRINTAGDVIWARDYRMPGLAGSFSVDRGNSRLVMIGDSLWVTGSAVSTTGDTDMILLRTDAQGMPGSDCVTSAPVAVTVSPVPNPVFPLAFPTRYDAAISSGLNLIDLYHPPFDLHPACLVTEAMTDTVAVQICQGQAYEGYEVSGVFRDTFSIHTGCDSIRVLDLTVSEAPLHAWEMRICPGVIFEGYSMSGVYTDTFVTSSGCDSIRRLTLVLEDTLRQEIEMTLCAGESYGGYVSTGIFMDTFVTQEGCDSIRRLRLTVIPVQDMEEEVVICEGASYVGYYMTGNYVDTFISVHGCDSIRRLDLSVEPAPVIQIHLDACDAWHMGYSTPGVFRDTVSGSNGCDTVRIVTVNGLMAAVPNVFSPNQDGVNDWFSMEPVGGNPELLYARLFDRTGGQVFEQQQWPVTWDGRDSRGRVHPPGVYTLVIRYACGGAVLVEQGSITLLR